MHAHSYCASPNPNPKYECNDIHATLPLPSPQTGIVTYEVDPDFSNPNTYKTKITYDDGTGNLVTVRDYPPWSFNIEVQSGSSVSLNAVAPIFAGEITCNIRGIGLNPVKGKTNVTGKGWTCSIPSQTVTVGE